MSARTLHVAGALLLCLGSTPRAAAQAAWTVGGRVAFVEQRVDAGFGPERYNGLGLGVELERRVGPRFTVALHGQGAAIRAAAAGDLDRRMGEAAVHTTLAIGPWWGLYGGLTLRAVADDAGRQRWFLGRIGAELHPAFTGDRIRAVARVGLIPVAAVRGLSSTSIGFDGAVGLDYARDRVALRVVYGLERFAFSSSNGNRREEQVSTLTFRAGIRLARRS